MKLRALFFAAVLLMLPAVAHADPCEASLPHRAGETFAGSVRYIGDGDSLCVGQSADPRTWIEVRLADFNAPELHATGGSQARQALARIALGQPVRCVAGSGRDGRVVSYDRVIATCRINGQRIGDLMRAAGVTEGGR